MRQPLDYVELERRRRISDLQPNWIAAIGVCILATSALGVCYLIFKIIAKVANYE